jgi:hypothetical protein
MTRITIDGAFLNRLSQAHDETELCDSAGHRLGYFLPDEVYRRLVCRWANSKVTDQELEDARQDSESFTTAEVLERLRNL